MISLVRLDYSLGSVDGARGFGLFEYINNLLSYDQVNPESLCVAFKGSTIDFNSTIILAISFFRSDLPKENPTPHSYLFFIRTQQRYGRIPRCLLS